MSFLGTPLVGWSSTGNIRVSLFLQMTKLQLSLLIDGAIHGLLPVDLHFL